MISKQDNAISEPSFAHELVALIVSSYQRVVGQPLIDKTREPNWLYRDAPFAVLAHDKNPDPRFIYANRSALHRFGYEWDELLGLPSRLSAEAPERDERQRLLDTVTRDGFISNYRGVRISKSGRRFWIENAIVWQLIDADGNLHGQAATFSETRDA